jgi:hypothetical protein
VACASVAIANDSAAHPDVVRVNFHPLHGVAPIGHAPDRGRAFTPGASFGWQ